MMNVVILHYGLGNITDWLLVATNAAALISGIILLLLTRDNVAALLRQLRSQSDHQIIESHKTLYMPIVESEALSRILFGAENQQGRANMLASMMINHAARIFKEHRRKVRGRAELDNFRRDVAHLFAMPIVARRWPEVCQFHDPAFVHFVPDILNKSPIRGSSRQQSEEESRGGSESRQLQTCSTRRGVGVNSILALTAVIAITALLVIPVRKSY